MASGESAIAALSIAIGNVTADEPVSPIVDIAQIIERACISERRRSW
jgi:hypothetical protein